MKLVTYESGKGLRVGVVEGDWVVDVRGAMELVSKRSVSRPLEGKPGFKPALKKVLAPGSAPDDMIELLERGAGWRKALGVVTKSLAEPSDGRKAPRGPKGPKGLFTPLKSARLRTPITQPQKITMVGLNYADHAREQGKEPPTKPIFFLKSLNALSGPGAPIVIPPQSTQVDYEVEFTIVIGKSGTRISVENAYDYVAGYTIMNDVSEREMQHGDRQWYRGKSCDTFGPTGPWIVTIDEIPDPDHLRVWTTLNGQTMQDSNTSNLVFNVPYLVSYLSRGLTWEVGDLVATGTPGGVGVFRKPQVFMKPGDTISVSVERIGTLTNPVVGPEGA
jgi:2-keto-4-pentenoate hydratase/2-oxohepta-3-ene-1,7-dioic acid hydratase in catechol pathway